MYKHCYSDLVTAADPPNSYDPGRWSPVFALLRSVDDEIADVYTDRGMADVRPRFAPVFLVLSGEARADGSGWTIRALAERVDVSHSAMSQTVAAMRSAALAESVRGPDGRTRLVRLTGRGERVAPFVQAEWRATEAALAELEDEIPYPLTRVADDIAAALRGRRFAERVVAHLDAAPDAVKNRTGD